MILLMIFFTNISLKSLVDARHRLYFLPYLGKKFLFQNRQLIFRPLLRRGDDRVIHQFDEFWKRVLDDWLLFWIYVTLPRKSIVP